MEKFIRWLGAVGRNIKGKPKVKITDEKIEIEGYEYVFENPIEKRFAEVLFSRTEVEVKSVKKRRKKDEGEE